MEAFVVFASVSVLLGILIFLYIVPLSLWFTAYAADVPVTLTQLIVMRIRKVPPGVIIQYLIKAKNAGLQLRANDLEVHYLSGGNVPALVKGMIAAHRAGIPLDYKLAVAMDLSGNDVSEMVEKAIRPKQVHAPIIRAGTKDGSDVTARAVVMLRANPAWWIGGAGEDILLTEINKHLATAIGALSLQEVLNGADYLSGAVRAKQPDARSAYEIFSLKINITG